MQTGRAARNKHEVQLKPLLRAWLPQACAKEKRVDLLQSLEKALGVMETVCQACVRLRGACAVLCRGTTLCLDTAALRCV